MNSLGLRTAFLDFFAKKGHKIISSSSLLPVDPTSLFTSAGMQQFVPYLSGSVELPYQRACSVQKCLRVGDIEEVGDRYHHTFFEMLGNWSFGDYFKEEAIDFAIEFLVDICQLPKKRLWVSIFKGEDGIPRDEESAAIWRAKGIEKERIFEFGMADNFWGPVTKIGPCGPCSEIFYDLTGSPCQKGSSCGPNCECGRFIELWNLVFMEYDKTEKSSFKKLPRQNVDTGIGFERLLSVLQAKESGYETDLFWPIIQEIESISGLRYNKRKRSFRILADHLRAVCFVVAEGVLPSNLGRGYVLRMLLRRIFRYGKLLDLPASWYVKPIKRVSEIYGKEYPLIRDKETDILEVIQEEEEKFSKTLVKGMKQFDKLLMLKTRRGEAKTISGTEAFNLYQSYGFPLELIKEMAMEKEWAVDEKGFRERFDSHKEISKKGAEKKFGGVGINQIQGAENKLKATKLHTATHLLHQALRQILGSHVQQMGSNITPDRLRFDFSHSCGITSEEIKKIEDLVNQKIEEGLTVSKEIMPHNQALKSGALAFFKEKYPKQVSVYTIKDKKENIFSKEICAGPHVKNISRLGTFKIVKEKSAGAGVRRIKAILIS